MTTCYNDPNGMPGGPNDGLPASPGPSSPITVSPDSSTKADDDKEWDWSHLAPDYTWKEFKQAVGWGPDHKLAREAYDRGQALYNAKKYDEAAKEFDTASWRWPDSSMEEDALFLMSESYFFSDRYAQAQDAYTNLLKRTTTRVTWTRSYRGCS